MRILCPGAALLFAACNSFPIMADPRVQVSPYLAVYQLRGDLGMQSDPGTGIQNNAEQSLKLFGFDKHREDVGVRVHIGDGFAGLEIDYYRLDQRSTRGGVLEDDFGELQQGDQVTMNAVMDEFRIGYLAQVLDGSFDYHDHPIEWRLALGGILAHRSLDLQMQTVDGARRQSLHADDDGVLYPAIRLRAKWQNVHLDIGYAISPELDFGGDFDGVMQDFEARIAYTVPYQDITLFAGYRYSTLPVAGTEGGFGYSGDLVLDGFQFGLQVSF